MLTNYLLATRRLLQNPPAPSQLYSDTDLTAYINTARLQLAGDSECVRVYAALPLTAGIRQYPFSAIDLSSATGVTGVFNVRIGWYLVGQGQKWVRPRPWAWFGQYFLNNPVPPSGPPKAWAQFAQGAAGSLFVEPLPDIAYVLNLDAVCIPVPLVDNGTPEAIPYPFTDAVPFFAAYYALLAAQSGARQADAQRMFQRYEEFRNRARKMSNPSVLPYLYEQAGNPVRANQLGMQPQGGGGLGGGGAGG